MEKKKYVCICGREFDNPQAFNGHKSHCKKHQLNKYGNLDKLDKNYTLKNKKISDTLLIKNKTLKSIKNNQWIKEEHKCECCGKVMTEFYGSGRFCSKSCANSRQHSEETKQAISKGLKSSIKYYNSNNIKNQTLNKIRFEEYNLNPHYCSICGNKLNYKDRNKKTCSKKCLHKLQVNIGLKTASKVCKRSKNEIALYELCVNYFSDTEVLHNEPLFNGWDADIIIPKYKIAILWNGPWHYRKITKNHSLKRVQNRDKIKLKEIKNCGYTSYIIKDLNGKYDINKVEREFEKLLKIFNL